MKTMTVKARGPKSHGLDDFSRVWQSLAPSMLSAVLLALPMHAGANQAETLLNQDRPGMTYRSLATADAARCRSACAVEGSCRAWTYRKPRPHGFGAEEPAVCSLKSGIPRPRYDPCCTSGVKPPPPAVRGEGVPPPLDGKNAREAPPPVVQR
jgi:hypothetical protein